MFKVRANIFLYILMYLLDKCIAPSSKSSFSNTLSINAKISCIKKSFNYNGYVSHASLFVIDIFVALAFFFVL